VVAELAIRLATLLHRGFAPKDKPASSLALELFKPSYNAVLLKDKRVNTDREKPATEVRNRSVRNRGGAQSRDVRQTFEEANSCATL